MYRNLQALHKFSLVCFCMIGFDVSCDCPSDIPHFFQNSTLLWNKHNRLHFAQKYARISFCPWKLSVPQSSHKYGLGKLFAFPHLFIKQSEVKPQPMTTCSHLSCFPTLCTSYMYMYVFAFIEFSLILWIATLHCNWPVESDYFAFN